MRLATGRRPFGLSAAALGRALSIWPSAALPQTRPPVEAFFQNPAFAGAALSPSGRHVAMAVSAGGTGRTRLIVVDAEKLSAKTVGAFTDADVGRFEWVNDDKLVFTLRDWETGQGDMYFGPGLFAVSREGGDFKTLVERSRNQPTHLSGLRSNTRLVAVSRRSKSGEVFTGQPVFDIHRTVSISSPTSSTLSRS